MTDDEASACRSGPERAKRKAVLRRHARSLCLTACVALIAAGPTDVLAFHGMGGGGGSHGGGFGGGGFGGGFGGGGYHSGGGHAYGGMHDSHVGGGHYGASHYRGARFGGDHNFSRGAAHGRRYTQHASDLPPRHFRSPGHPLPPRDPPSRPRPIGWHNPPTGGRDTFGQGPSDPPRIVTATPNLGGGGGAGGAGGGGTPASGGAAPSPALPRPNSGLPPLGETRFLPDQVLFTLRNDAPPQALDEIVQRHRLVRVASVQLNLIGSTIYCYRVTDGRSVPALIRELEAEQVIASSQPNYRYRLEGSERHTPSLSGAQYSLAKMHLPEAHRVSLGEGARVAVIDSGVDLAHPELAGAVADSFDALGETGTRLADHGTAIAGIIAAHGELIGVAPRAKVLAIRAFGGGADGTAEGNSAAILAGIDYAFAHEVRIINMSFAGPYDPLMSQTMAMAHRKGGILIAAAGNEGPHAAPLYPAADPNVIAVTATDAQDKLFAAANRGPYIRLAAPGKDILVAAPGGTYQFTSGTSMAAAQVSGIAALMLSQKPNLDGDGVRVALTNTAHALAPNSGEGTNTATAGMSDAYAALGAMREPHKQRPLSADIEPLR